MTHQDIEARTLELFRQGYHCAEAVLAVAQEAVPALQGRDVTRLATCFGGGVGRTKADVCGAFTGGLIALGCLCGRDVPGQDWSEPARLAAAYREGFTTLHGSTRCPDLLASLGEQDNMTGCKQLTGKAAALLVDLLREAGPAA